MLARHALANVASAFTRAFARRMLSMTSREWLEMGLILLLLLLLM